MYRRASTIFYILSGFVLFVGLFVLQPAKVPEVAALQKDMTHRLDVAWQQTIGDQPYFDSVYEIIDGVTEFYNQSARQMIALMDPQDNDQDLAHVFAQTYRLLAQSFHLQENKTVVATKPRPVGSQFVVPVNFMVEQPLYNIVPDTQKTAQIKTAGIVSGAVTSSWVTIQDNMTGQPYCLAIYNGEVNKYLGRCRDEYR